MISLRNKLGLGFASLLLILLAVSAVSIIVFTRYSYVLERAFRENYDSALYCNTMKDALDQLDAAARQIIRDPHARPFPSTVAAEAQFASGLASQIGNVNLPGEREATAHLSELWDQYRNAYQKVLQSPGGQGEFFDQSLAPQSVELRRVAQKITDTNMSNMATVNGRAKQTLLRVRNTLLILVAAATVLAVLVVWAAGVAIFRPLGELTQAARQIEGGNLDLNLNLTSNDEIGKLVEAFSSMAVRLREFKRIDHDRLTRTEQTTQLAIDSLPDAVFVIGPDDSIEIANDSARAYFGIEVGRNVMSLGLNWLTPLYEEVKKTGEGALPRGYKSAIQLFVDGEERFLLPRVVPMRSADHRQVGVTAILVDVTQLRHVDEAKSSLVSTVSHELRTPLTSQRLLLGLLLTSVGPRLSANEKKMLEVAKADNDRLYRTIDDLLGISRIESGRAQFQFRSVSPKQIVATSITAIRPLFELKKLRLDESVPDGLPAVRADEASINSALTNLLSNALKFTPAGGQVTLCARENPDGVLLSVADTGPGIPAEFRPRIFEKFFRVPGSGSPSGAGLGLAITRDIVEAHGGHISFHCPPEGGTVFQFTLPLAVQTV